jgi:hypothetical protein
LATLDALVPEEERKKRKNLAALKAIASRGRHQKQQTLADLTPAQREQLREPFNLAPPARESIAELFLKYPARFLSASSGRKKRKSDGPVIRHIKQELPKLYPPAGRVPDHIASNPQIPQIPPRGFCGRRRRMTMPTKHADELPNPTPIELNRIVSLAEASRLSSLSVDTLRDQFPEKIVRLSPKRC